MIVKRRYPVPLYKEGNKPRLPRKTFHYILDEDTDINPTPLVDIVLTSHVSGIGNPGDILSMKKYKAYYNFLLPGLADYVTPESMENSRRLQEDKALQKQQLSPSVDLCIKYLEKKVFSFTMNMENEWTLEPWHVRANFRKAGVHIMSDSCIEMPKQPIRGPNMELEGKEFTVILTINKDVKVKTRCRIHHWSTNIENRIPYEYEYWLNPCGQIFPEEESNQTKESEPSKI